MWVTRLRWRMRGAWMWPSFAALTLIEAVLLERLPVVGDGTGSIADGILLAGFGNLFVIAVLAPLAGLRLRRRRPDLPKVIATDYAGTTLLGLIALAVLAAGLVHRPIVAEERDDRAAAVAGAHAYVLAEASAEYRQHIARLDLVELSDDVYRSCVPGDDPRHSLCLIVRTDQRPAGVTRDKDETSNLQYRLGPD